MIQKERDFGKNFGQDHRLNNNPLSQCQKAQKCPTAPHKV